MLNFFPKSLKENSSAKTDEVKLKDKLENIKEIIEDKSRFYILDEFLVGPYLKILTDGLILCDKYLPELGLWKDHNRILGTKTKFNPLFIKNVKNNAKKELMKIIKISCKEYLRLKSDFFIMKINNL